MAFAYPGDSGCSSAQNCPSTNSVLVSAPAPDQAAATGVPSELEDSKLIERYSGVMPVPTGLSGTIEVRLLLALLRRADPDDDSFRVDAINGVIEAE